MMDYDLLENDEKHFYRITGVRSLHGEVMKFVKVRFNKEFSSKYPFIRRREIFPAINSYG